MINAVQIARFRGIRDLVIERLGRVNLIIGKNDSGKTALMEAMQIADDVEDAAHHLLYSQRARLKHTAKRVGGRHLDFERFWRPIFFNLDAKTGISISSSVADNAAPVWKTVDIRQGEAPDEIISVSNDSQKSLVEEDEELLERGSWSLDLLVSLSERTPILRKIIGTSKGIRLPSRLNQIASSWIDSCAGIGTMEVKYISELKRTGDDESLIELLKVIDDRLSGVELLAPGGDAAELFVRLGRTSPPLPVALMGEGFQRCLELGATVAAHGWPTVFVDEIENGMHHLALEPLWRWLVTISNRRNLQIFATTHSEECIQAARGAFDKLGDDGLRVIRLDRHATGTRASMYDRRLVEIAERTGTEIRG